MSPRGVRSVSKKILLVDDEPDIHLILKKYLEKIEGVDVVSARDGSEGVRAYRELLERGEEPALVVMDLNLCGSDDEIRDFDLDTGPQNGVQCDGVRAAEEILRINPHAAIWVYSAWADTKWAQKLREKGVQKLVDRIPFREFAAMVEHFLKKQKE